VNLKKNRFIANYTINNGNEEALKKEIIHLYIDLRFHIRQKLYELTLEDTIRIKIRGFYRVEINLYNIKELTRLSLLLEQRLILIMTKFISK
jgi:hypothetical protein